MINLQEIENLVRTTPKDKIENMISYLKGKKPSSLKPIFIQEDLNLDRSQTDILKKILEQISDCDLLSVTIQAALLLQNQNKNEISRLVLSGDFQHKDADYTHQTIHQMIDRANHEITIIGYWVWGMGEFFEKLSTLSENIEIKFILDNAKEWEARIKKNWNRKSLPKIFEINRELLNTDELNKLHSKIIIIDDDEILVTSANLTIVAMESNIETGIWTRDKKIVNACKEIFEGFERRKIFVPLEGKKY